VCPRCGGGDDAKHGCIACHGTGLEAVTACPFKLIDADFFHLAQKTAQRARYGNWPITAGWLDQTHAVNEAVDLYRAEFPQD
jgi:hypothetical protein